MKASTAPFLNTTSSFTRTPGLPATDTGQTRTAAGGTPAPLGTTASGSTALPPGCIRSTRKQGPDEPSKARKREQLNLPPPAPANSALPVGDFLTMWASHPAAIRIADIVSKAFRPPVDAGDTPTGTTPLDADACELPSGGASARQVSGLIDDAKAQGFTVEFSPSLREALDRDPQRSLDGVVVIVGDTSHIDMKLQRTIEALISRHFKHGGLFTKGDDMLAEVNWRLCLGSEWHSWWYPFNSPCLKADKETLMTEVVNPAFIAASRAALAFMETIGVPVHDTSTSNAVLNAAAPYIDPVLNNPHSPPEQMAAARVLDKAWKQLDKVMADTTEEREITQRAMVLARAGDDHATFFVPGDKHARRIYKDIAPLGDVLYLRKAT